MREFSNLKAMVLAMLILLIGLATTLNAQDAEKEANKEKKVAKQRKAFDKNRSTALKEMYKAYPESKGQMAKSYGYAAFANTGVNLFSRSTFTVSVVPGFSHPNVFISMLFRMD